MGLVLTVHVSSPNAHMDALLDGPLPGCDSLEQAEELYRLDAMQTELRMRRVHQPDANVSIKEIEKHFDDLRVEDPQVYVTTLYARSRLLAVCSDLTEEQLRNAMRGTSLAVDRLYGDHDGIRFAAEQYRTDHHRAPEEMLVAVHERVLALLPHMLAIVAEHAATSREAVPRRKISTGVSTGGVEAEAPLSPVLAQAMLRLRTLIYLRHPIDLLREIHNWLTDMENSE